MEVKMNWFISLIVFITVMQIFGGLSDAWMYRNKADFDGKDVDYPDWLGNLSQIFWLGGFGLKFVGLPLFGIYSPLGPWKMFYIVILTAFSLSFIWDMTFSYMKTRTFTKSLKYWILIKKTKYTPYIRIGWESKQAVIASYIIRALILVPVYIYLVN